MSERGVQPEGEGREDAPLVLSASQAAVRLGVTRRTITNLVAKGLLHPRPNAVRVWREFDAGEVEGLAQHYVKWRTSYGVGA